MFPISYINGQEAEGKLDAQRRKSAQDDVDGEVHPMKLFHLKRPISGWTRTWRNRTQIFICEHLILNSSKLFASRPRLFSKYFGFVRFHEHTYTPSAVVRVGEKKQYYN